jgi:hypothetical protein
MAKKSSITTNIGTDVILYQTEDGKFQLLLKPEQDSVWLTLNQIAELYQTSIPNISMHIRKILLDNELEEWATVKQNLTVQIESGREVQRNITFYNLNMILAVGYRVKSNRGTQFRQWATQHLSEYLIKGFILDDERLKGNNRITDYFDELLARIRDIRASEARVYTRVREIFALASDYRSGGQEAQLFFAKMQNKMHYAATGFTAAEIIQKGADASKPNMGLTNWKGNRVQKTDIVTAKNYLNEHEIDTLNRIVVMFLDQAEFRVLRRQDIQTKDWEVLLDKFLHDNELPVLATAGSISHEKAVLIAEKQYELYANQRRADEEEKAESRYLEDLKTTVKAVAAKRKK